MKHTKLKPMAYGWLELIKVYPKIPPKGYSNAEEVGKKLGVSTRYANATLQKLYKEGKVDRVEIKHNGRLKYFYKD